MDGRQDVYAPTAPPIGLTAAIHLASRPHRAAISWLCRLIAPRSNLLKPNFHSNCSNPRPLHPYRDELHQVRHYEPRLLDLQADLPRMVLRPAIEAGAIGPSHPRLPQLRLESPKRPGRADIFDQTNNAVGLHDAGDLTECRLLQLVRQDTEQERCHGGVERTVGEPEAGHVHLP